VLAGVIARVQAWEVLCDPAIYSQLTAVGVYELTLRAGYGEEAAQEAATRRGWDRLSAGQVQ
jgi:hypothetical protein